MPDEDTAAMLMSNRYPLREKAREYEQEVIDMIQAIAKTP